MPVHEIVSRLKRIKGGDKFYDILHLAFRPVIPQSTSVGIVTPYIQ
jgi:hypothetical protein